MAHKKRCGAGFSSVRKPHETAEREGIFMETVSKNKKFIEFIITTAVIFLIGLVFSFAGINAVTGDHGFPALITFILAFMPIILVMIGMLGFGLPGIRVAPAAFVLAVLLSFTYFINKELGFGGEASAVWGQTYSGLKSAFFIVGLIFFSFLILDMMQHSGAMDIVKNAIATISPDRRVQLILIGLFVPIFMEGAAGAGTPAAIAGPFLVGLGFDPVLAVVVALMSDGVCTSFGGSGLTTMGGGADLVSAGVSTTDLNFAAAGMFHMIGILVMPFLILFLAYGKKAFKGKGIVAYALYSGICGGLLMFLFSNIIGGFVTDMGVGVVGIIFAVIGTKIFKIETPEEYFYQVEKKDEKPKYSVVQALSPYIFILVMFPIILTGSKYIFLTNPDGSKIALWNWISGKVTYNGWIDILLFIVSILSIFSLRYGFKTYCWSFKRSLRRVLTVFIIMASLYSVANIMKITYDNATSMSMIKILAYDISNVAGVLYPAAAVLIGAIGAFITGTNLGANQLFATMHMAAAENIGINQIMTFASNNAGGSLGNMICPNNVTAACATVGLIGQENKVMRRVVVMFIITCLLYMVLSLLYVYVIFPNVMVDSVHLF